MPPLRALGVQLPEYGRNNHENAPQSHEGSISSSQNVEIKESNPWASETGDEWSAEALESQHRSSLQRQEGIISTTERGVRPPRHQGITARSNGTIPSRDTPTINDYTPRDRPTWETDLDSPRSSESHDHIAGALSSSHVRSHGDDSLGHNELVLEIQRLQKRLEFLQQSDINLDVDKDTSTQPWKILHEVRCLDTGRWTSYLDEPELENDQDLMHLHWQGKRHVTNVKAWIRKQNLPFVVYRRYYCVHERKELRASSESIHIRSRELDNALMSWLEASSGLAAYGDEGVYADNMLQAPYLCFYHFRNEAVQFLSASGSSSSQDTLSLLGYLDASTTAIAQEAEKMFTSGKVTAKLMPYLFKPGALVCFEESGNSVACEQTSVLTMSFEDQDLQRKSFELTTKRVAFDGKFRHLRPSTHRIDIKVVGDQPVNISDLSVRPLSCLPSEHRLELARRGKTFLRCQKQRYVTYPSSGVHHDFVCHHCACPVQITNIGSGRHPFYGRC